MEFCVPVCCCVLFVRYVDILTDLVLQSISKALSVHPALGQTCYFPSERATMGAIRDLGVTLKSDDNIRGVEFCVGSKFGRGCASRLLLPLGSRTLATYLWPLVAAMSPTRTVDELILLSRM